MKILKPGILFFVLCVALAAAAMAEPTPAATEAAAAAAASLAANCAAKPLFSTDFSESYVCGACSGEFCHGNVPGTFCGLDELGYWKVCQDQMISCTPGQYPNDVYCKCTSAIIP